MYAPRHPTKKMSYNLEVDVNGHETFFVNKEVLVPFSGKLQTLFSNSKSGKMGGLKVIFNDFPGGPEGFEQILKFCYNGGKIDITSTNVFLLHFAAKFMEINEDQTKKYLETIHCWTLSELLDCLKHCRDLLPDMNSLHFLEEILDSLIEKISMSNTYSLGDLSYSDKSSVLFSSGISSNSSRFSSSCTTIWLKELEFLNVFLLEKVVKHMISRKLDQNMICSFLLHYQKVKFASLSQTDKCNTIMIVVNALHSLDESLCVPFRDLCRMLQICSGLKMEKNCIKKLEMYIGSKLDHATLDDLLVAPSPSKKSYAYDVNLVLKFLKVFLGENRKKLFVHRLKKVGCLMDLYIAEVAPDPHLKPRKFQVLASALPDKARDSYDRIYEAMDIYFKVHKYIREAEKIKICDALNYDKLSSGCLMHLAKNAKYPACAVANALICLHSKLKTALANDVENLVELRCNSSLRANEDEPLLLNLLKGKKCRKVQNKSADIVARTNVTCSTKIRSLPRLCS